MPESFFILLAGGVMLAVSVSDSTAVTVLWLRLAGTLALVFVGLGGFFFWRSGAGVHRFWLDFSLLVGLILGQLGCAQMRKLWVQQGLAYLAVFVAVAFGADLIRAGGMPK